jgi:hypothetical protein
VHEWIGNALEDTGNVTAAQERLHEEEPLFMRKKTYGARRRVNSTPETQIPRYRQPLSLVS